MVVVGVQLLNSFVKNNVSSSDDYGFSQVSELVNVSFAVANQNTSLGVTVQFFPGLFWDM